MRIAQIVGARPQFIKYSAVFRALKQYNASPEEAVGSILIHTGQHYDYKMSEIFFHELGMNQPEYHLGVGSGAHGLQTAQVLQKVEDVLLLEKPDAVVVYGDTNSTLGGALAAVKLHIPVAHIEAGLRSYNKAMPEEINRVLTDHSSALLLCPTRTAVDNLLKEGFRQTVNGGSLIALEEDIAGYDATVDDPLTVNVGDVMYDVLLVALEIAAAKSGILADQDLSRKQYNVLTLHRAENTDNTEQLQRIMDFMGRHDSGVPVIFPAHPRTIKALKDSGIKLSSSIRIIEPLGYFDMLWLLSNSARAFTDSGGLQKEAYLLRVPCVTLREETEWVETVQSGWNILYREYQGTHLPQDKDMTLYGDGKAAEKIVNALLKTIGKEKA